MASERDNLVTRTPAKLDRDADVLGTTLPRRLVEQWSKDHEESTSNVDDGSDLSRDPD